MIPAIESRLHRLRQRVSRSEWAIRHLNLTPSEGTSEKPGLLLIQIDGLARHQLERAVGQGRMPFLRRLMQRDRYQTHTFYPGLPSTTPAVQAELYYGVKAGVPAFSFLDRKKNLVGRMFDPDWAKEFEARFQAAGLDGLLKGGSSWSNIYTGGATQAESHFCAASIGFGDMWRTGKIRNIFAFILLQLPAAVRIAWQLVLKTVDALWDAWQGVRRGERLGLELIMAVSRVFIGTGLRELVTIGAKVDLARGLPIVHVNFLAYDEQAHRRGPGSRFAFHALRATDRAIKNLYHQAHRSRRRDYVVWIFSDHGQEATQSFALASPGGIEEIVHRCLETSRAQEPAWHARSQHRLSPWWFSRHPRIQSSLARQIEGPRPSAETAAFTIAAVGPVGHLYFPDPRTPSDRADLARRLVNEGGVPGVLTRNEQGIVIWYHLRGETVVPDEVPPLLPHPAPLRAEIARDLVELCAHADSGDLILLGWSPWATPWTFAPEKGAHGGPGPEETQGFALLPPNTYLPPGTDDFIRPSALRLAALHVIHRATATTHRRRSGHSGVQFRVMTYNVHGCSGMDGRISPRRIARGIGDHAADIIALQELDFGRDRSRTEDQTSLIAAELGLHFIFCPTVVKGTEHYGHALLSRWPIELVKRALLPAGPGGWWPEPRAALWAKVTIGGRIVQVVTTHLGLSPKERKLQVQALLGEEWIGSLAQEEAVVLCGDFNLTPRSKAYAQVTRQLRDTQVGLTGHRPLPTFTSARPVTRLDYIFVSSALDPQHVFVPRTQVTRLASDHLPLVVDLQAAPAASARTDRSKSTPRPSKPPTPANAGR